MKTAITSTLLLLSMSQLTSCGKASPTPEFETGQAQVASDGSNISGRYKAEFITLNTGVIGFLTIDGYIIRKDDQFNVRIKFSKGAPNTWHKQDIYTGWRCPNEKDDSNKDGFVDIKEGKAAFGNPLIPLDSDITSQAEGKDVYPVSDSKGSYSYARSSNFDEMFKDLKGDAPSDSSFAKLQATEGFPLEGNVIVITGAPESANLPSSVATLPGRDSYQSLPVACALIRRIGDDPGTIEADTGDLGNPEAPRPSHEPAPTPTTPRESLPVPPTTPDRPERDNNDGDSEDWDDNVRDWWRRTFGGGGSSSSSSRSSGSSTSTDSGHTGSTSGPETDSSSDNNEEAEMTGSESTNIE